MENNLAITLGNIAVQCCLSLRQFESEIKIVGFTLGLAKDDDAATCSSVYPNQIPYGLTESALVPSHAETEMLYCPRSLYFALLDQVDELTTLAHELACQFLDPSRDSRRKQQFLGLQGRTLIDEFEYALDILLEALL